MAPSEPPTAAGCPCALFRSIPGAFLLLDPDLRVVEGNDLFWHGICNRQPAEPGVPVREALPADLFAALEGPIAAAVSGGCGVDLEGLPVHVPGQPPLIVDLHVVPTTTQTRRLILIASNVMAEAGRRLAELTLLHNTVRVLRQATQIERVLFTVLTCATAGSGGMGFNRAWVFLVDPSGTWLEGRLALGPASAEDAARIWDEIGAHPPTLEDLVSAYDRWSAERPHELERAVRRLRFSMADDAAQLPVLAAATGKTVPVDDAATDDRVGAELRHMLGAREFVVAPMTASGEPCGVIMADNLYSRAPITRAHVRLLSLFAQHAGMAIEHARLDEQMEAQRNELSRAYVSLKETHQELVRAKQLAAVGEMSARVAHDLRNPLVTIAGWARVLEEEPGNEAAVRRASAMIANQARALEKHLSMLVEPLGSRLVRLEPTDLGELVRGVVEAQAERLAAENVRAELDLQPDLPAVPVDQAQFRRSLTNLIDNAVQAMPDGGSLRIALRRDAGDVVIQVADTGVGMEKDVADRAFDAFFTTRHHGSGLGLAVVLDIVRAHGGRVDLQSTPGQGTVLTIHLPVAASQLDLVAL
jgi:signal transduction histidine kinase